MRKVNHLTSVPSWATCMIRNYRHQASIPETITDLELYKAIENEDICLFDDPQDQTDILRSAFNLD